MAKKPHIILGALIEQIDALLNEDEEIRIVTDVGASMFSGYGDLQGFEYDEANHLIILKFE